MSQRSRRHISKSFRDEVVARFVAGGRICAICGGRVAEDEPIDIHHLTSWAQMRCMGQNPDVLKNLAWRTPGATRDGLLRASSVPRSGNVSPKTCSGAYAGPIRLSSSEQMLSGNHPH